MGGIQKKYFGTDGIRGAVGKGPITPDFVLRLANAVGRVLVAAAAREGHDLRRQSGDYC